MFCKVILWPKVGPVAAYVLAYFIVQWAQREAGQMAYRAYNPNPDGKRVGDCTVRAISAASGKSWEEVYIALAVEGFALHDMPSANRVWGSVLRRHGWHRQALPNTCPDCYTVADFAADHPAGAYILALPSHVVTVIDGDWLDTWDSGEETPLYYWQKG